jgi:molybdopterin synthase sulfur carrier subunit
LKIKIEFFAILREILGMSSMEVECEGTTIEDILNLLLERFGSVLENVIFEGGRLKDMVKILLNGKDIRGLNGLNTELKDGDCISIFPPVAGG